MATYSSILAWGIPQTEEVGGLQFMGSQGVGHNLVTKHQQIIQTQSPIHTNPLGKGQTL